MRLRTKISLTAILVAAAGLTYFGVSFIRHGFSAREKPSQLEEFLAWHARRLAIPATAKTLKNHYRSTNGDLSEGREHWVEHCATCHSLDGSGNTVIGRNLYPKAPDMRDRQTQGLSDGELYYIIGNGIRFTGMPAWGDEDNPEDIWKLVLFIRHLPQLTPDELKTMQGATAREDEAASPDWPGIGENHETAPQHRHTREFGKNPSEGDKK